VNSVIIDKQSIHSIPPGRMQAALKCATEALLGELNQYGHWEGELSSSALSTATAITALALVDRQAHAELIASGVDWLATHQNNDGGWGDTVRSKSNISTTALCWAALAAAHADETHRSVVERAEAWLARATGRTALDQDALIAAIEQRYGKDRTFSVPIVMMCTLAGRLSPAAWRRLFPLPFELAALPRQLFGALQLPVVSYALPALIAIGQVIHHHAPSRFLPLRWFRSALRAPTRHVLKGLQPASGGFLEATPLTSFVTMALAGADQSTHPVACKGVEFLLRSVRPDGSWAIDTNLATWVTTLSIKALAYQPGALTPEHCLDLREWLLDQQYRSEHPYTHAAPGGWAWTNLSGGVPDADDTPGALLALLSLGLVDGPVRAAGIAGVTWLLDLQNRDGGVPTFCRGWGALPFDRSSPDLTAHTLRAWSAWLPHLPTELKPRVQRGITRGLEYLAKVQRADGSWLPLWFGNEHAPDDENPIYGTTHILYALRALREASLPHLPEHRTKAEDYLADCQQPGGGWSGASDGPPSVEETALAVKALAGSRHVSAVDRGTAWLVQQIEAGTWREPAPIGFYFAKLWYHERLYPLIWTVGALGKVVSLTPR
jgi:squalene-hopene/tetraprenyl-beta-curcumene cyclase